MSNTLKIVLLPFSGLFYLITGIRNLMFNKGILKEHHFPIPIISVGNITVGGTGKTPHIEYLIKMLAGKKTVILSRGYGRKSKGFYWVESDGNANIYGDEPLQIKNKFRESDVAVCEKRVKGIKRILHEKPDTDFILLDDAYQHRQVKPSFNILLVDFNRPMYNDLLLPSGRLRETLCGMKRANFVIVTKCLLDISVQQKQIVIDKLSRYYIGNYAFSTFNYANHFVSIKNANHKISLQAEKIILLTGIAQAKPMKEALEQKGFDVIHLQYSDHYAYKINDLEMIEAIHKKSQTRYIVTSEKDAIRLKSINTTDVLNVIYYWPIEVAFLSGEAALKDAIRIM